MVRSVSPKYIACTNMAGYCTVCGVEVWSGNHGIISATGYGKAAHRYLKSRQVQKIRYMPWMTWKQKKLVQIQGHYNICPVYTWVMNQCLVSLCEKGDTHTPHFGADLCVCLSKEQNEARSGTGVYDVVYLVKDGSSPILYSQSRNPLCSKPSQLLA